MLARTRSLGTTLATLLWASLAHGHASEVAPAPAFDPVDCIERVDRSEQAVVPIRYQVIEEQRPDADEPADSRSYQFFAFGRHFPDDQGPPLWISQHDWQRAVSAGSFGDAGLPPQRPSTLEESASFRGWVHPISAADARIPITEEASQAVAWDTSSLPPGSYRVAAYIWSPPFNGWAFRPGVVQVTDGRVDELTAPAITLGRVNYQVPGGSGLQLTGCVSAPDDSLLVAYHRNADVPGALWAPFAQGRVEGSTYRLCFLPGSAALQRQRFRVDVVSPGCAFDSAFGDTLSSFLSGAQACLPGDDPPLCCAASELPLSASQLQDDAGQPSCDPQVREPPTDPTSGGDGGPTNLDGGAPSTLDAALDASPTPIATDGAGCSCSTPSTGPGGTLPLLMLLLTIHLRPRRRRA